MPTNKSISNKSPLPSDIPRIQQFARYFIVPSTCVLCLDQILNVGGDYALLDFTENGGIELFTVKFMHATQIGYILSITMLNLDSEELIMRSHRLTNDICDWVIIEANLLFPDDYRQKAN